jgi:hypothetical protein
MKKKSFSISAWLVPSLSELLAILVFISVIGLGPRMINMDGDLGRHLTVGKYILSAHTIPTHDLFSHTLYQLPLTPHEWLAEGIFAVFNQIMGLNGVILLSGVLLGGTFYLLSKRMFTNRLPLLFTCGLILAAAGLTSTHWLARPHLFTFLFIVLWMEGMQQIRAQKWIWTLPMGILMLIWVNTHGAFLYGMMIAAVYFLDVLVAFLRSRWMNATEPLRPVIYWILFGAGLFGISLINPAGVNLWLTATGFLSSSYLVSHTVEYMPPALNLPTTWLFILLVVLGWILLFVRKTKKGLKDVLLFILFASMGMMSARSIPIFALVCIPILAVWISEWLAGSKYAVNESGLKRLMTNLKPGVWSLMTLAIVIVLFQNGVRLDYAQQGNRYLEPQFPVSAADWMADHPLSGNGFNYFQWGGFLLYRFWPEQRVFIDGQTDFYGEKLTREYETVIDGATGWESILDRYEVSWMLIPVDAPLMQKLTDHPEWNAIYRDSISVIFSKTLADEQVN